VGAVFLAVEKLTVQTLLKSPAHRWVRTWGAAMQAPDATDVFPDAAKSLRDLTLRHVVRVSLGGSQFRLWFSNECGDEPLALGKAHLALSDGGATILGGTDRELTFAGSQSIVVPSGTSIVSDVVSLPVPRLGQISVSLYLPGSTMNSVVTLHQDGRTTSYVSATGNHCADRAMVVSGTSRALCFLSAVDVLASPQSSTLVALGDSITDGYASKPDMFGSWPDVLAERMGEHRVDEIAVANMGISGNRLLRDWNGPSALARFNRDVLGAPNVHYLTILVGINDIGASDFLVRPNERVDSADIIAGLSQLVARAQEHGIRVFVGTLMPIGGSNSENPGYDTKVGEQTRQAVNEWLRGGCGADAVIDFDKVMRDPDHIERLRPDYDCGDHLHPNDAGYRAMAEAFDLRLLK
jgi:lysophospholipase L1-like esterase